MNSYPGAALCGPPHLHGDNMGIAAEETSSGSHFQIRDGGVSCETVVFSVKERSQAESLKEP